MVAAIVGVILVALTAAGFWEQIADAISGKAGQPMKLHDAFLVDGKPILGSYLTSGVDELALCKDIGMNLVIGGHAELDTTKPEGAFCRKNGIKVMHHMTQHIYGKPRLGDILTPQQTDIPFVVNPGKPAKPDDPPPAGLPSSGVFQIDDETIYYGRITATHFRECVRGYDGTRRAEHRAGAFLFFPEAAVEEIREARKSPNLWGYYVLDDSPGDAISALRALYRTIKKEDPGRPVCAGYGSAGSLCNFGPGVCDIMMLYWYPVKKLVYNRMLTPHQVQWMVMEARKRVPGIPFLGVYQTFDAMFDPDQKTVATPTAEQIREQIEDFVREGASGLVSFLCSKKNFGFAYYPYMANELKTIHREILETGELRVRPETEQMASERIQPAGYWDRPRPVPGIVPAWWTCYSFADVGDSTLATVFPPDTVFDLNAVYPGGGWPIRWTVRGTSGGTIGLGELGPYPHTNCTAYAVCSVTSPIAQKAIMCIGTDEDALIKLNGSEVWRFEGSRGLTRGSNRVSVTLPKGESRVFLRVHNRNGMWGFDLRFLDPEGEPLEGLTFSPQP
jgi:hypothetical protein